MSFVVENNGGNFERCPPGLHLARCYRIVDLGTQKVEYKGQIKYMHKVSFTWEIHGSGDDGQPLSMNDGRPYAIFKNYTLSWSDKANLRKDLQSWRGRPFTEEELRRFDLKNVLGAWCMLNVIERPAQSGSAVYSNVDSITPVPGVIKSNGLPQPVNPAQIFNLQEPDMELYESFSDNLKAKIAASPEWQKISGGQSSSSTKAVADDVKEDVPF